MRAHGKREQRKLYEGPVAKLKTGAGSTLEYLLFFKSKHYALESAFLFVAFRCPSELPLLRLP